MSSGEALPTTQGMYVVQTLFLILFFIGTCDICRNDIDRQSNNTFKNIKNKSMHIFVIFLRQDLMWLRLALNSINSWGWPRTPGPFSPYSHPFFNTVKTFMFLFFPFYWNIFHIIYPVYSLPPLYSSSVFQFFRVYFLTILKCSVFL